MDGAAGLASSFFFSPPLRAHRRLLRCGRWWVWWTRARTDSPPPSSQLPIPILRGRGAGGGRDPGRHTLHGQLRRTAPRAGHSWVRSVIVNAGWLMDPCLAMCTQHTVL